MLVLKFHAQLITANNKVPIFPLRGEKPTVSSNLRDRWVVNEED